jgi:hypothetical protein
MKSYARIEGDTVAEVVTTAADIATLFHPGLRWVDVTDREVATGDLLQDGAFVHPQPPAAPAAPTLAALQAEIARLGVALAALASPANTAG